MSSPRPTLILYLSTVSEIVSSPRLTLILYLSTVSEIVSSPRLTLILYLSTVSEIVSSPRLTLILYLSTVSEIVSSPRPTLILYLSTVSEIVSSPRPTLILYLSTVSEIVELTCSVSYAGLDMEILRRRGNLSHSEWTLYTCSGWAVSCTVILLLLTIMFPELHYTYGTFNQNPNKPSNARQSGEQVK